MNAGTPPAIGKTRKRPPQFRYVARQESSSFLRRGTNQPFGSTRSVWPRGASHGFIHAQVPTARDERAIEPGSRQRHNRDTTFS